MSTRAGPTGSSSSPPPIRTRSSWSSRPWRRTSRTASPGAQPAPCAAPPRDVRRPAVADPAVLQRGRRLGQALVHPADAARASRPRSNGAAPPRPAHQPARGRRARGDRQRCASEGRRGAQHHVIYTSDNGYLEGEHRVRKKDAALRGVRQSAADDPRPGRPAWRRARPDRRQHRRCADDPRGCGVLRSLRDGIDLVGLAQDPGTGDGRSSCSTTPLRTPCAIRTSCTPSTAPTPTTRGPRSSSCTTSSPTVPAREPLRGDLSDPDLGDIRRPRGPAGRADRLLGRGLPVRRGYSGTGTQSMPWRRMRLIRQR